MKVLVVHPRDLGALTSGGIQTFLHDFVKFAPADFEITVAGVTRDQRARPIGRLTPIAIEGGQAMVLPLGPPRPLPASPLTWVRMALAQLRLRRAMFNRHTIVQVHSPFRGLVLAGQRGPRLQFVHFDVHAWPKPSGRARRGWLYGPFSDATLGRMARVYIVSERGAQTLRARHPALAERIEFLPVWYDPAIFNASTAGARDTSIGGRQVLFAGRLDANKDPLLALEVIARLSDDVHLLIAGDGELRAAIEQRSVELGIAKRVHLLGDVAREELARLMRAADCLLMTSHAEGGGPRVVVEALACGLPVVATDVGEVRRAVSDGVNGRVVGGHEAGPLADALAWTLSQPRDSLASAALAAAAPFAAERVLEPLYATYRRLVAEV